MNEIMFDTDVLVDLHRGLEESERFFDNLPEESVLHISVITKMELVSGCKDKGEQRKMEELTSDFSILPISCEESLKAYELYVQFYLTHGIGILDCLIGSTAITHNLPLYTKNVRHFKILPGLETKKPY